MTSSTKPAYLVWDTETTGVDALNDRIIQLVIATADEDGNVIEHWEWFINPDVPVPDEAAEVHGFTNEYLAEHGRPAKEVFADAIEVFRRHHRLVQVAYNLNFDLTFLDAEFKRWGVTDTFGEGMSTKAQLYDPYVTDRANDKYRKGKRKLMNLADHYGVEYNEDELHNALADVTLTAKVAVAVRNKYGLPKNAEQTRWYRVMQDSLEEYLRRENPDVEVNKEWPMQSRRGDL